MSKNGLSLPEFKQIPSNQKKITSFFAPANDKWSEIEKLPPPSQTKDAKTSKLKAMAVQKRVSWSPDIKLLAVNRHITLKGSYYATIKDLRRTHPNTVFEALTVSVLQRWVSLENSPALPLAPAGTSNRGRKTILPEHLLIEMKSMIQQLIQTKARMNTKPLLLKLTALVIKRGHGHCLEKNGGNFKMDAQWLRYFLRKKMNLSRRAPTTAAQKLPSNFEELIFNMVLRVACLVFLYDIPLELVVNSDQTGIQIVPSGKKSWNHRGVKEVPIIGNDDCRQITAMVSSTPSGKMLPLQLIFSGTEGSKRATPNTPLTTRLKAEGWHLTQSPTHWSTMQSMKDFVNYVLVPYYKKNIEDLKLNEGQKVIWIIDCWSVHKSAEFRAFLREKHPFIMLLYVPASCTSKGQPQDVSLQKPLKQHFTDAFDTWATNCLCEQLNAGKMPQDCKLNLKLKEIKPLVAGFLFDAHSKCAEDVQNVILGWEKPGLLKAWDVSTQKEAIKEYHKGTLFAANTIHQFPSDIQPEFEENHESLGEVQENVCEAMDTNADFDISEYFEQRNDSPGTSSGNAIPEFENSDSFDDTDADICLIDDSPDHQFDYSNDSDPAHTDYRIDDDVPPDHTNSEPFDECYDSNDFGSTDAELCIDDHRNGDAVTAFDDSNGCDPAEGRIGTLNESYFNFIDYSSSKVDNLIIFDDTSDQKDINISAADAHSANILGQDAVFPHSDHFVQPKFMFETSQTTTSNIELNQKGYYVKTQQGIIFVADENM